MRDLVLVHAAESNIAEAFTLTHRLTELHLQFHLLKNKLKRIDFTSKMQKTITMEFGKTAKMNLAMCFYDRNQTEIFHWKRLVFILICAPGIWSTILFVIFEADNVAEYVTSAFINSAVIGVFSSFIDTSCNSAKIFTFFDLAEKIIERSKHFKILNSFRWLFNVLKLSLIYKLNRIEMLTIESNVHQK